MVFYSPEIRNSNGEDRKAEITSVATFKLRAVVLSEAKNLCGSELKQLPRFFASLRMTDGALYLVPDA
jgi:hypothetical protein